MNKILLTALLGFTMATHANAQEVEYGTPQPIYEETTIGNKNIRFGLFIAPGFSWMKPTSSKSDDKLYSIGSGGSKAIFAWGLMMDYYFAENYGIATGFTVTGAGGTINSAINLNANNAPAATDKYVQTTDLDYKLRFLEIPFALKLRSDRLNATGIRLFGQIGITAAACIGKKADYEVTYNDGINGLKTVSGQDEKLTGTTIAPVMLQLNIGGGIEYPITRKLSFYSGIFFNNGFLPDATYPKNLKLDYAGKFDDGNIRMNSVTLRLGLFF